MKYQDSKTISCKSEYMKEYKKDNPTGTQEDYTLAKTTENTKLKNAIENALDIRKFEIDLYWKRANYFWLYNVSACTAYFYVISNNNIHKEDVPVLTLLITGIGVFLSLCWVCINIASKSYQENWEKHVDLLEDDYMGPLYKRTLGYEKTGFEKLINSKISTYSVSKINLLLSRGIVVTWLLLWIYTFIKIIRCYCLLNIYAGIIFVITLISFGFLFFYPRTDRQIKKPFKMKERILG
jgi:hypothetical protein